jgi:hypothetical protein
MVALINLQMVKTVVLQKQSGGGEITRYWHYNIIAIIDNRVRARQTAKKRLAKED